MCEKQEINSQCKDLTRFDQARGRTGCPTPWADADGFVDYLKASLPVGAARPIEDIRAGGLAKGCQAKTIETGPALVCSLCSEHPGWSGWNCIELPFFPTVDGLKYALVKPGLTRVEILY